jgi:hypothetical protein
MNKCGPQETSSEVCVANPRFLRNQKLTWYVSPGVVLRSCQKKSGEDRMALPRVLGAY